MMKVTCISDEYKPESFPASRWIKKGKTYTLVKVLNMAIQGGQGFVLEEIDMAGCEPYVCFGAWRFRPLQEGPKQIEENELELAL